jgi:thioredoxin 1
MLELDKTNFDEHVLQSKGYVLVDFWSESCEPCKALTPDVEALAQKYEGKVRFAKLNAMQARRLAISQQVLGLPTILLYKDGQKVDGLIKDEVSRNSIEEMLKKYV